MTDDPNENIPSGIRDEGAIGPAPAWVVRAIIIGSLALIVGAVWWLG